MRERASISDISSMGRWKNFNGFKRLDNPFAKFVGEVVKVNNVEIKIIKTKRKKTIIPELIPYCDIVNHSQCQ
ncbi:hypothetical protein OENI_820003 [Oenococcus oeni]|nr:hypothetical protein OENI_820003 [Oenococcus oeni]